MLGFHIITSPIQKGKVRVGGTGSLPVYVHVGVCVWLNRVLYTHSIIIMY